jgi:predicted Zn finger-like uncharacterized protein
LAVDVQCERCGTSYALDAARLGEAGARVRCARCGHVFLVPKSAETPPPPARTLTQGIEGARREWRVRRKDGTLSSLRELTTLQRWIVEGKLGREDEVGLDGENWRQLGTIPDLGAFFVAADAKARVIVLEEELARAKGAPPVAAPPAPVPPSAPALPTATVPAAAAPPQDVTRLPPPARMVTSAGVVPVQVPRVPTVSVRAVPQAEAPKEPAFTRTAAGLGVAPTDDWEPPKLRRGMGAWVVVLLLLILSAGLGLWGYFYIWVPERERAHAEQARNSKLEQEQSEHEAKLRAAEQRAKDELLQTLAASQAKDGGMAAPADAGPPPRGALEIAPPAPPPPSPQEARVSAPTLVAAPTAPAHARQAAESPEDAAASTAPSAAPAIAHGSAQTFEEWMAEGNKRRTHERASSALAAYDRALALKPQSSDAHAGRGLALLDLGRRPEALAEFQRALELDPRDGVAVLGLAETYRSLGRSEEARRAYQRYLDGWPTGAEARAARAALESLKE